MEQIEEDVGAIDACINTTDYGTSFHCSGDIVHLKLLPVRRGVVVPYI